MSFTDVKDSVAALEWELLLAGRYEAQYPGCRWLNADCNGDGLVNFDDINAFVGLLSGQ